MTEVSNPDKTSASISTASSSDSATAVPVKVSNEHESSTCSTVALPKSSATAVSAIPSNEHEEKMSTTISKKKNNLKLVDYSSSSEDEYESENEDPSKSKDPFINTDLHYYIMHQKTKSNLSLKQSKRITSMADVYSFNGLNIIYSKNKHVFK